MDPLDVAARLAPTGALRVVVNLGNPVLATGTPEDPAGVTVALARELARRLDRPLDLRCVDAARLSLAALVHGEADVAFLAAEPARAREVRFTRAYLTIEGVYVAPAGRGPATAAEVDRPGTRVGVKEGSAYDLHLSRSLQEAEVVRGAEGLQVYLDEGLEVGAAIRQPATAFVEDGGAGGGAHRVLEPAFMQIRQALAVPLDRDDEAVALVDGLVGELLASGFVRAELARSGQDPDLAVD
ncbi:transporter substrate-binding domain-containing protein [Nocardioides litoris]|uniref:transporter substrate-binding domain-containing protein n=1 Tax=Nocardioides litoris TaxID=1926648 RepID=UPI00111DC315|nr:transporter substrate-binding domain-containing protein [Nocardioides litoris]